MRALAASRTLAVGARSAKRESGQREQRTFRVRRASAPTAAEERGEALDEARRWGVRVGPGGRREPIVLELRQAGRSALAVRGQGELLGFLERGCVRAGEQFPVA